MRDVNLIYVNIITKPLCICIFTILYSWKYFNTKIAIYIYIYAKSRIIIYIF